MGYLLRQGQRGIDEPRLTLGEWQQAFDEAVAGMTTPDEADTDRVDTDRADTDRAGALRVADLRSYQNLSHLALALRKPMFDLTPADGAIGSTQRFVQVCRQDFRAVARELGRRAQLSPPSWDD